MSYSCPSGLIQFTLGCYEKNHQYKFKSYINFAAGVETEPASQNSPMPNSTCSPIQVNKLYFQGLSHLLSEHGTLEALVSYQTEVEHFWKYDQKNVLEKIFRRYRSFQGFH